MLSKYALISFAVYNLWDPKQNDSVDDKAFVENIINAASIRLADLMGHQLIYRIYTEIYDMRPTIRLRQDDVHAITTVTYDSTRAWDGENDDVLVAGDDYFYEPDSREINMLDYIVGVWQKTTQIVYTAGNYPLVYQQTADPETPKSGQVWKDLTTNTYKLYSTEWTEVDEDMVINDLLLNALVELVSFNKQRLQTGGVGKRSITGSGMNSFFQQVEIEVPQNVLDMIMGQKGVI